MTHPAERDVGKGTSAQEEMTEPQNPHLRLGEPPGRLRSNRNELRGWLIALFVLQWIILLGLLIGMLRGGRGVSTRGTGHQIDADELRAVAIDLQDKSLYGQAAQAWERYLEVAAASAGRAEVLFNIGKLHMQAEQFDRAAAAYVRCEQAGAEEDLKTKIGPYMITCLKRLGLYGEVGRELSRRIEVGAEEVKQGRILATLSGQSLTEADVDRMVEQRVDQMLALQGSTGDEETRLALLKQFSQPQVRRQLLEEMLQVELFTRRARELKLDQEEEFLKARRALEENLLASRFQGRELDKIQPTDVDVESYYQANKEQYRQPESMEVIVVELKKGEDPKHLLQEVQTVDDFKQLARQRLVESGDEEAKIATQTVVRGRRHFELGDVEVLFNLDEGKWTSQPHVNADRRFLVYVERKSPVHTPPLSDVRARVESDYVARKREELSRQLFDDLSTRYQLKIISLADSGADNGDAKQKKKED